MSNDNPQTDAKPQKKGRGLMIKLLIGVALRRRRMKRKVRASPKSMATAVADTGLAIIASPTSSHPPSGIRIN